MATRSSIDQLNSYLRGEIAAVETYQMALHKLDEISTARDELLINLKSHEDRVMMLQDMIMDLGGEPATTSGAWGMFAKAVEGGAKVFGDKATVAALEEGEEHGLDDYEEDLDTLDPDTRSFVVDKLLPEQQHTHARLTSLKHRIP